MVDVRVTIDPAEDLHIIEVFMGPLLHIKRVAHQEFRRWPRDTVDRMLGNIRRHVGLLATTVQFCRINERDSARLMDPIISSIVDAAVERARRESVLAVDVSPRFIVDPDILEQDRLYDIRWHREIRDGATNMAEEIDREILRSMSQGVTMTTASTTSVPHTTISLEQIQRSINEVCGLSALYGGDAFARRIPRFEDPDAIAAAKATLLKCLSLDQRESLEKGNRFTVEIPRRGRFEILYQRSNNVRHLETGDVYCMALNEPCPTYDIMLSAKLMLEHDANGFFAVAVRNGGRHNLWNHDAIGRLYYDAYRW